MKTKAGAKKSAKHPKPVRDKNRQPQTEVSTREDFLAHLRDLHAEMRKSGSTGFTAKGWARISAVIAGE